PGARSRRSSGSPPASSTPRRSRARARWSAYSALRTSRACWRRCSSRPRRSIPSPSTRRRRRGWDEEQWPGAGAVCRRAPTRAGPLLVAEAAATGRADRPLQSELAIKDAILASTLDALVALGPEGRIVEWNASAERTFGWKRDEVLGRSLEEVIVPVRLRSTGTDALRRAVADGDGRDLGRRIEMPAVHRDGREFPIELAITRVDR